MFPCCAAGPCHGRNSYPRPSSSCKSPSLIAPVSLPSFIHACSASLVALLVVTPLWWTMQQALEVAHQDIRLLICSLPTSFPLPRQEMDRLWLSLTPTTTVISEITWRVSLRELAHEWLEKLVETIFEQKFSRIMWCDIIAHLCWRHS